MELLTLQTSHDVFIYIVGTILTWKLLWLLVYLISGFHISYISVNNGLLLNSITIRTRDSEVTIKSVRFRLWGNTRKWIIDDLKIIQRHKTTKSKKKTKKVLSDLEVINVYPSNRLGQFIMRIIVKHIPSINLEFRNTELLVRNQLIYVEYLTFSFYSRYTKQGFLKFILKLASNNVKQPDGLSPYSVSSLQLMLEVSIDLANGNADNLKIRVFLNDLMISIFNVVKLVREYQAGREVEEENTDEEAKIDLSENKQRDLRAARLRLFSKISICMAELSIHLENSQISEIPFSSLSNNQNFGDYFGEEKPQNSIEVIVKSCSWSWNRVYGNSAGYEYLFNSKVDKPIQLALSVQLFKVNYKTVGKRSDEVLCIPNYSANFKSNIGNHLMKGYGFKNSVVELFVSASSPIIDMTTLQLSELFYNFILLQKYFKLKKLRNPAPPKSSNLKFKQRLVDLLEDYYPNLDLKLIVEQPRFIIRHHVDAKIQLLTFSYSLLNFHLLTTESRDYHANCNILSPSVVYFEKIQKHHTFNESLKVKVLTITDINLTLNVLKNLKVKMLVKINECVIDSTVFNSLIGIRLLLQDFIGMVENDLSTGIINLNLNSQIISEREKSHYVSGATRETRAKPEISERLFKYLPSWLLNAQLDFTSISILLGSRSVLIPKELLSCLECSDFSGEQNVLRYVKVSLENWTLRLYDGEEEASSPPTSSASSTSLHTITENPSYWQLTSKVTNFNVAAHIDLEKPDKLAPFLKLPLIEFCLKASSNGSTFENSLTSTFNVEKVNLVYDNYKLFTLLGSVYLVQEFLVTHVKAIQSKLKKDFKLYSAPSTEVLRKKPLLAYLTLDARINEIEVLGVLNNAFKVKFQSVKSSVNVSNGIITVQNDFFRGLTESTSPNQWSRILCMDSLKVVFNDPNSDMLVDIFTDSIRLNQPNGFVVHKLFDNIATTVKAAKYLFKFLKSGAKEGVIEPSEMKTSETPDINLKSRKVTFGMEDDPFECELNMIYQLGIIEQRKRMELWSLFEEKAKLVEVNDSKSQNSLVPVDSFFEKLKNLHEMFSKSWIRKVKLYKSQLKKELLNNKRNLFGNEATYPSEFNQDIVPYPIFAPLLSIIASDLNLNISSPKFDLDELPEFLYNIGQGVPKDTKYSLMLPTYLDLSLSELRMHLRDYPLPLLHVPNNKDKSKASMRMSGHLIIGEDLIKTKENVQKLDIGLTTTNHTDKYHSMTIAKSLSTVKLYADLSCVFDTENASRFVWGHSYLFGIQQAMLNFDQFSKAPIDPSNKLGFWDKMKLVMHGRCQIKTDSRLEVAMKGSSDPYALLETALGFVLSFEKNVICEINADDDSKLFVQIKSDNVSFYIPNYLGAPLIPWARETSTSVYLPSSKEFITSTFGFNLLADDGNANHADTHVLEKVVVNLSGGVEFVLGFLLQRKEGSARTSDLLPHYKVKLFNPEFTKEGHDSFTGFRSDYIHMAIALHANKEASYNSIHLSPRAFEQFFKWWKLFSGNTSLPIRKGKLFGELKKSQKFSQLLFTNKFEFNFDSVFISHMYRDEDGDDINSFGVRAKVDSFLIDLHQRKEAAIEVDEGLAREKKIMKMNFNVGEVHLTGIDLRVIHANFKQNRYDVPALEMENYKNLGNDKRWFDIQDFEEAFVPSLKKCPRTIEIHPLLFSKRFSYIRNTNVEDSEGEDTHVCTLNSKEVYQPQIESLEERIDELKEQIAKNDGKKKTSTNLSERIDFLRNEIKSLKKKCKDTEGNHANEKARSTNEVTSQKAGSINGVKSMSELTNEEVTEPSGKPTRAPSSEAAKRPPSTTAGASANEDNCKPERPANNAADDSAYEFSEPTTPGEFFNNKFVLVNMFLKWNVKNRNYLLRYLHFLQLKRSFVEYLSYESICAVENIIKKEDEMPAMTTSMLRISLVSKAGVQSTSSERLDNFDKILRATKSGETISENYLIEIISPQIQLQSDDEPDSVVIVATPQIDAKIVSVMDKSAVSRAVESRYGVLMKKANIFVLHKKDLDSSHDLIYSKTNYGSKLSWPPWLGIEICKNAMWAGEDKLLVEKTSLMLIYEKAKPLKSRKEEDVVDEGIDRLQVDFPKLVMSSTSQQYFTLYVIVQSLLSYKEPLNKKLTDKLEQLKFSVDFQDLLSLKDRLVSLQNYHKMLKTLLLNYGFRQNALTNEQLNEQIQLNIENTEIVSEVCLLMQTILRGDINRKDKKPKTHMSIQADEIILHMLEDDRTPILDLAMANARFKRLVNEDGLNGNKLQIGMMQGFNLIKTAEYREILEPYNLDAHTDKNMLAFDWTMNRSIGGIQIIENVEIASLPLKIKIDEITGKKLTAFIFRAEEDIKKSPLVAFNQQNRENELMELSEDSQSTTDKDSSSMSKSDKETSDKESSGKSKSDKSKHSKKLGALSLSITSAEDSEERLEQVKEMIKRSKMFFSIIKLRVQPMSLQISINLNKGYKRLLNVQDFLINLPEFVIEKRIMSFLDITGLLQKMVLKSLAAHSGRLLKNKFKVKKSKSKKFINRPIKPLKKYVKFTRISELQAGNA